MNRNLISATSAVLALCPLALHAQTAPPLITPAVPAPAAPSPAGQPVTLRYKFAVGQTHRYEYDTETNTMIPTGQAGAGIPMNTTVQMVMRQTVKSIRPADGAATLVTQIESMHMLMNGREMPAPAAQQEKMKQPFTEVMLPTGKMLSLDVPAMGDANMPGMDIGKSMLNSFSGTAALPEGPVKVGDTWKGGASMGAVGIDVTGVSSLTALEQKNGATLAAIHTKMTGTLDNLMTEGAPAAMKINSQFAGETIQVFDTTAGLVQSTKSDIDMDMTMAFGTPPPGAPSAMKMQMHMKYTMQLLSDTAVNPDLKTAPVQ